MPNDRVDAALAVISAIAGEDDRRQTENELRTKNLGVIDQSLSIGGFRGPFKSEPETFRRSVVRAVLLVKLARGSVQTTAAGAAITTLMTKNTAQLQRDLLSLFPFKPYRGDFANRTHWLPANFTDPRKHSTVQYKYLVHTLMQAPSKVAEYNLGNQTELENFEKIRAKFGNWADVSRRNPIKPNLMVDFMAQYLSDPTIIRANIISGTLISEAKHATYYPMGFIMRVPPECIYITSPKDLGIVNRTTDIMAELQLRHAGTDKKILLPDEVLAATNQSAGATGYNEVVVVGTSPEGKQVDVIGLFVKTDANGNLFVSKSLTTQVFDADVWLTPKSVQLIQDCAKKFNLPIVKIPDATSGASNKAWPFNNVMTTPNPPTATVRPRSNTF